MKLTKDTLIEGKIFKEGVEIQIDSIKKVKENLTNTTVEENIAIMKINDLENDTNTLQVLFDAIPPYSNLGDSIIDLESKVEKRYYQVYHNFFNGTNNEFLNNAKEGEVEALLMKDTLESLGYKR